MTRRKKRISKKREKETDSLQAFVWFVGELFKGKLKIPINVSQHLKVLAFLSVWLTIPFLLFIFIVSPSIKQPELFPVQLPSPDASKTYFKIKLKGVRSRVKENQPLFIKAIGTQDEALEFSFSPVSIWQDEENPEIFWGTLNLDSSYWETSYTIWLKGPVHLQRRLENVFLDKDEEIDLTGKPLLPGDLVLPEVGQDDKVDQLDRDYLFSLVVKDKKQTEEEINSADLDLDGKITSRDYSLLIDTGVGVEGEK